LVANAAYSLISWPLAMHYLKSDSLFGLWGLMASIAGYMSLIDLGMSGSVARLLIDHKDDPGQGNYGSLIKTGWLVLTTQATIILMVGFALSTPLSHVLKIEPEFRGQFVTLMRWQTGALALGFFMRIFSHMLTAHQRLDIINYSQIGTLILNLGLVWFFLGKTHDVLSLAWAALISAFCGAVVLALACWMLRIFPPAGAWGRPSWRYFQELFGYGKDLLLVSVGAQLIVSSQSMIITGQIALAMAGVWYAGTRAFNLISQAVWRISDVTGPAFSEMMARGERDLLRERYRTSATLTASFAGFAAVSFALCNSLFVTVVGDWTHHPVKWAPLNDVLLGLWMITNAIQRSHNMFITQTKRVGFMRYIFFVEGLVYVGVAILVAPRAGLPGIIACSVLCSTVFSGAYSVYRISKYFEVAWPEIAFGWLVPMGKVLLCFGPAAIAVWLLTARVDDPFLRFLAHTAFCVSAGAYIFLRFGLSNAFQRELLQRAPSKVNPLLRWVFVGAE
jgi:O-antigen/teichoic acid export membrane protein